MYNVYDWLHQRRDQVKLVKNICYHPPSLLKKSRGRSTKRGSAFVSAKNEPNRQIFELYQNSLRASQDQNAIDMSQSMGPMSNYFSENRKDTADKSRQVINSAGISTGQDSNTFPEVHSNNV